MRHVGEGVGAREVGNRHVHSGAVTADAMNLFQGAHHVLQVFEHVVGVNFLERVVGEGPGHAIQVVDDIGAHPVARVEVHRARERPVAASDVQPRLC